MLGQAPYLSTLHILSHLIYKSMHLHVRKLKKLSNLSVSSLHLSPGLSYNKVRTHSYYTVTF